MMVVTVMESLQLVHMGVHRAGSVMVIATSLATMLLVVTTVVTALSLDLVILLSYLRQ